jgi:hypothetical protein
MKNLKRHTCHVVLLILAMALLSACAAAGTPAASVPAAQNAAANAAPSLLVTGGDISKSYTRADLEALASSQATFKGVVYKGVTLAVLLQDAGIDRAKVKAVKAEAGDGFTVNYDPSQVLVDGVILAYARADGDLAAEDGPFRMVLPDAEGKLNPRQLVKLQIVQ